jgi:hypothetical protein
MSALDEITKEKQRVSAALAQVDEQRGKLAGQLSELEAAERVLARYSKGTTTSAATPARSRRRPRNTATKTATGKHSSTSLADQVLALATGKPQQEIAAACKGARPNHVGMAIARHKRAGRLEESDGKLYARPANQEA